MNYYKIRGGELEEEMLELLERRLERTKDQSEVVSSLNLQIATGAIDELGALAELEIWRDENRSW